MSVSQCECGHAREDHWKGVHACQVCDDIHVCVVYTPEER